MPNFKKIKTFQKGFSLIEMILVIFVIIAIGALIANLPSSLKLIGAQKKESIAKEIATKKIEDLRSQPFENLIDGPSQITDSRFSDLPQSSGNIQIQDCPQTICQSSETNIKQINVTITWVDSGVTKNVQLSTLISKGGLK